MKRKFNEFDNLGTKLPLSLQFFADDPGAGGEQGEEPGTEDEPAPSSEEQLQQLRVEMAKLKRAQEKAASEAADYKKKYNATLTESEQKKQSEAEREAVRDEEFKAMKRKIAITDLTNNFMDLGYSKDAAIKAATAQHDGDVETSLKIQKEFMSSLVKQKEAEWLKNRPKPQSGADEGGTDITKEQFNKMGYSQRLEFKNKYPEAYKSYTT